MCTGVNDIPKHLDIMTVPLWTVNLGKQYNVYNNIICIYNENEQFVVNELFHMFINYH